MSDNKIALTPKQVELIEKLANIHEVGGLQPAMAKILALLTVSDDVELTFDQVRETLDLSKSAVSQALNQLILTKKITYKSKIGDRKRYFQLSMVDLEAQVTELANSLLPQVKVYNEIIAIRPSSTKEFNKNLQELTNFTAYIGNQLFLLYKKYKEEEG